MFGGIPLGPLIQRICDEAELQCVLGCAWGDLVVFGYYLKQKNVWYSGAHSRVATLIQQSFQKKNKDDPSLAHTTLSLSLC